MTHELIEAYGLHRYMYTIPMASGKTFYFLSKRIKINGSLVGLQLANMILSKSNISFIKSSIVSEKIDCESEEI